MPDRKPIASIMEEAANIVLALMNDEKIPSTDKVKAFQSLTDYYVAERRAGAKNGSGDDKVIPFDQLRDRIRSVEGNGDGESA